MELMPHQKKAIKEMHNGCILHGGTGSGKSATVLGYYLQTEAPKDIYVITTARKRDSLDWLKEAGRFGIGSEESARAAASDTATLYGTITVDSWQNIHKYTHITNAFFVMDEQRLVGNGTWVKSFLTIAKQNNWILLSATPGDTWMDYVPVFLANGYYRNLTDFKFKHVVYEPFTKYPKIRLYLNETKLELLRNEVLVEMPYVRHTKRILNWIEVDHDKENFKRIFVDRWNIYEDRPIKDAAELYRLMRTLSNSDPSRLEIIEKLFGAHPRMIIFYNFDYELRILRTLADRLNVTVCEWNGHKKEEMSEGESCIYLVQYVAGAEAWNCVTCNGMVFYSMPYSYKNFEQAQGRIDRLDTPYTNLYYYVLASDSYIDRRIRAALEAKKSFNQRKDLYENLGKSERDMSENGKSAA